jgi:hypothetical protein
MIRVIGVIMLSAFILTGCGNGSGDKGKMDASDSTKVLPATGGANERVFQSTGEVVIAFSPSAEEIRSGNKVTTEQLNEFNNWYRNMVTPMCKEKGIETYQSSEDNIMLKISEKERFTILRTAFKNPFGVIITKAGSKPIIMNELVSQAKLDSVLTTLN